MGGDSLERDPIESVVPSGPRSAEPFVQRLYLELLRKCLTFELWDARDGSQLILPPSTLEARLKRLVRRLRGTRVSPEAARQIRAEGRDWPEFAHTMIGGERLLHLQRCVEDVVHGGIPGDLIELGVWRGGATILMRAVLKAYDVRDRIVWVADSFEGLPPPDPERYPADRGDIHHRFAQLAVSLEEVKANFERYGLLDDQVRFLKGWFSQSLPAAPIGRLALIRLDADMYESTTDGLSNLYDKLSPGGYFIIDDYGAVAGCRRAVDDFRRARRIEEPLHRVGYSAVYWRRAAS